MIKQVDRYVGKAAVAGILGTWAVLLFLYFMFHLLDELRSTQGNYTAMDTLWFVLLITPRSAYEVFPACALMGALVGVGGLAAGNELVAFRTSGVSRLRLAGAALGGALLVTLPVVAIGEWMAPAFEQQARVFRFSEKLGQFVIGGPRGLWLRDGERFVNIQKPLMTVEDERQAVEFRDVFIYDFAGGGSLGGITHAGRASHDGERWSLQNVRRMDFGAEVVRQSFEGDVPWESRLEPELVDSAVNRPAYMSVRSLLRQLDYMGQNGLDDRIYRSALFAKLVYPLTVLALVLAGMPFVFAAARSHRLGVRLFIGMTVGVVFTIVNRAVQNIGDAYGIAASVAALLPSLALALVAILVLRRAK
jgi:lipopolysaccharide export system permease protein